MGGFNDWSEEPASAVLRVQGGEPWVGDRRCGHGVTTPGEKGTAVHASSGQVTLTLWAGEVQAKKLKLP
jgi:hypothetical protein